MPTLHHILDPLGTNPNNLVSGEVATGIGNPNRIIKPLYGPFHIGTQVVVDTSTNTPLTVNVDYDCVGLLQEASIKFQKPIAEFIRLKNPSISPTVRLNYQTLGGDYQNDTTVLANLWNSFINDNRPVSYATHVIDKPFEFPPSLHPTFFKDVTNFEPLITALERMTQAILISNVPAFQNIIDWVLSMQPKLLSIDDVDNIPPSSDIISHCVLVHILNSFIATDPEALAGIIEHKAINPKQLKASEIRANDYSLAMSIALG